MSAKKSFKGLNPALSFIDSSVSNNTTHPYNDTHAHADTDASTYTDAHPYTHHLNELEEISPLSPAPSRREVKSRRLQLLIKPSVHAAISTIAGKNSTSVNDTINSILEKYLRGEGR